MSEIAVTLVNGDTISVPAGTTAQEALAKLLSNKQRKKTIAASTGEHVVDLLTPLSEDTTLTPILTDTDEGLEVLRHSTAHIMAHAVRDLFGDKVKVAIGPSIENGFYYDFLRDEPFTPEDFEKIEARMTEIASRNLPFERYELSSAEALEKFKNEDEK